MARVGNLLVSKLHGYALSCTLGSGLSHFKREVTLPLQIAGTVLTTSLRIDRRVKVEILHLYGLCLDLGAKLAKVQVWVTMIVGTWLVYNVRPLVLIVGASCQAESILGWIVVTCE